MTPRTCNKSEPQDPCYSPCFRCKTFDMNLSSIMLIYPQIQPSCCATKQSPAFNLESNKFNKGVAGLKPTINKTILLWFNIKWFLFVIFIYDFYFYIHILVNYNYIILYYVILNNIIYVFCLSREIDFDISIKWPYIL